MQHHRLHDQEKRKKQAQRVVRSFCLSSEVNQVRRFIELQQRHANISLHEELQAVDCQYASCPEETEESIRSPATSACTPPGIISATRPDDCFLDYFGREADKIQQIPLVDCAAEQQQIDDELTDSEDDVDVDSLLPRPNRQQLHHDELLSKRTRDEFDSSSKKNASVDINLHAPSSVAAIAFDDVCSSLPRNRNRHESVECVSIALTIRSSGSFTDAYSDNSVGEVFVVTLREILDPDFIRGIRGGSVEHDQFLREESQRQARLAAFREIRRMRRGTRAADVIDLVGLHCLPGRCLTEEETALFGSQDEEAQQQLICDIAHDVLLSLFEIDISLSPTVSVAPFLKLSYQRSKHDGSTVTYNTRVLLICGALELKIAGHLPAHVVLKGDSEKTLRVFSVELAPVSEKVASMRVVGYHLCPRPQFEAAMVVEYAREVFRQATMRRLLSVSTRGIQFMRLMNQQNELIRDAEANYTSSSAFLEMDERRRMKRQTLENILAVTSHCRFDMLFSEDQRSRRAHVTEFDDLKIPQTALHNVLPHDITECVVALRKHYGFRRFALPIPLLEGLLCAMGLPVAKAREVTELILCVCDSTQVGVE